MTEEKTVGEVYDDRNALALGFTALCHRYPGDGYDGWWRPEGGDDADSTEWAILYAETPAGQVSWHVPMDMAEDSAIPRKKKPWDGHTREVKNERLKEGAQLS